MQKHVNTKMILGIVIASAFLLGSMVTPVAALQTNMVEESFNYAFAPGANNHTYIYSPADDPLYLPSQSTLHANEDIDCTTYSYESSGWWSPDNVILEDTSMFWPWESFSTMPGGTYGNPSYLPNFYDFTGSDGSGAVVNTTIERRSFSLALGSKTAIAMDSDYIYYGTLAISGQEFVHLRIASLQDGFSWTVSVFDPQGRSMASVTGTGGDIVVLPFRPSTSGTYIVKVDSLATNGQQALFELFPEAIAPTLISPGQVITDTLPTGEIRILDETGSWTHDELVPTVKTYKMNPGADISALTYAFNYPIPLFGTTQPVSITFTSDAFHYGYNGGYRYRSMISPPSYDVLHFRDGIHYVTVMGGDNTDFSLYHEGDVATESTVNDEFRVDNLYGHTETNVYSLTVPEDSVLKLNTTLPGNSNPQAWAILDTGYRHYHNIQDDYTEYTYLVAGDYIVEVDVLQYTSEWMEFTLMPLTTDLTTSITNVGGWIVPTDSCREYNLSLTLQNLYNVSVPMEIGVYNQFYAYYYTVNPTLGTWYDGSSQIPHATHETTVDYDFLTRTWSDDYTIIIVETDPYNNTLGVGDYFEDFPVELTLTWEDVTHDDFVSTAFIDASTTSDSHNFTLDDSGTTFERYSVLVNTTPGTWYNVTIGSYNVNLLNNVYSYATYNERTHYTSDSDLTDALQGFSPDWSIQFGAISDSIYLEFEIIRFAIEEGHFYVRVTPMDTYLFEHPDPLTPAGLDILGMLGSVAVPLGIGVVVIVVVAVVYVKKFKN